MACNFSSNYYEIAIVGEDAIELSKQLHKKYIPNAIIAGSVKESTLPILQNRFQNKKTLIYTCIEGACNLPEENVQNTLKKIKIKF